MLCIVYVEIICHSLKNYRCLNNYWIISINEKLKKSTGKNRIQHESNICWIRSFMRNSRLNLWHVFNVSSCRHAGSYYSRIQPTCWIRHAARQWQLMTNNSDMCSTWAAADVLDPIVTARQWRLMTNNSDMCSTWAAADVLANSYGSALISISR